MNYRNGFILSKFILGFFLISDFLLFSKKLSGGNQAVRAADIVARNLLMLMGLVM